MIVDCAGDEWCDHISSIIRDIQRLFTLLVLPAGVADAFAPFLATVFEPSPWSTERSSFPASSSAMTEARNRCWYEPSFDHRLCHL